jgi:hypothetical protein
MFAAVMSDNTAASANAGRDLPSMPSPPAMLHRTKLSRPIWFHAGDFGRVINVNNRERSTPGCPR